MLDCATATVVPDRLDVAVRMTAQRQDPDNTLTTEVGRDSAGGQHEFAAGTWGQHSPGTSDTGVWPRSSDTGPAAKARGVTGPRAQCSSMTRKQTRPAVLRRRPLSSSTSQPGIATAGLGAPSRGRKHPVLPASVAAIPDGRDTFRETPRYTPGVHELDRDKGGAAVFLRLWWYDPRWNQKHLSDRPYLW